MHFSKFILIVDASNKIGFGHLQRCLVFADFLRKKKCKVFFITSEKISYDIILSKGFDCIILSKLYTNFKNKFNDYSVITDLPSKSIFKNKDEYHQYFDNLKKNAKSIISFEDLQNFPYCNDIVIIPYFGAHKLKLKRFKKTKYLLGTDYFILRDEFYNNRFIVKKRAKKLLITMGGSDPNLTTLKVLHSIRKLKIKFDIIITLGAATNIKENQINIIMRDFKGTIDIHKNTKNMAKLMLQCDLAITNDGLTKYELSATGVPFLIVSSSKQQELISKEFSLKGSGIHIGNINYINKKTIQQKFLNLFKNHTLRLKMSNKGKNLFKSNSLEKIWQSL